MVVVFYTHFLTRVITSYFHEHAHATARGAPARAPVRHASYFPDLYALWCCGKSYECFDAPPTNTGKINKQIKIKILKRKRKRRKEKAFAQFCVGLQLERQYGTHRIFPIYMLCGIAGNLMSALMLPQQIQVKQRRKKKKERKKKKKKEKKERKERKKKRRKEKYSQFCVGSSSSASTARIVFSRFICCAALREIL